MVPKRAAGQVGLGPSALVLTKNKALAQQHQKKIIEYGQGTLSTYTNGAPVDPHLLTADGRLNMDKLNGGELIDSQQVGLVVGGGGGKGGKGGKGGGKGGSSTSDLLPHAVKAQVVTGTITKVKDMLNAKGGTSINGSNVRVVVFDEVCCAPFFSKGRKK